MKKNKKIEIKQEEKQRKIKETTPGQKSGMKRTEKEPEKVRKKGKNLIFSRRFL